MVKSHNLKYNKIQTMYQITKSEVKVTQLCLLVTPWTTQSMEFSRPEYWSG